MIEVILRAAGKTANPGVVRGIGDDCAILQVSVDSHLLVTTDLCVENVHFRREWHPAKSVGRRCLARGLSDIAAMGGEPFACFLSLALPSGLPQRWVNEFLAGLLELAGQFRVTLAGGDIAAAEKITADIIVLGKVPAGGALLRSGAHPGDRICVTGELGGSASVLKRLYAGKKVSARGKSPHLYPAPRIEVGQWLRKSKLPTAMIDISDGLSVDLAHLCKQSKVSALVNLPAIPVARGADLDLALHGGEDYELLFTVSRKAVLPARIAGVRITAIGEVRPESPKGPVLTSRDSAGRLKPLKPAGWEHLAI